MPDTVQPARGPRLAQSRIDDGLADALRKGAIDAFDAQSPVSALLMPLLDALDWRGGTRDLFESMPHFAERLEMHSLRSVLLALGYKTRYRRLGRLASIDGRLLPCIVQDREGKPFLVKERAGDFFQAYCGTTRKPVWLAANQRFEAAFLIDQGSRDQSDPKPKKPASDSWALSHLSNFRLNIVYLFILTFFLNLAGLTPPLYIMALYDQVIPLSARDILIGLSAGVILALVFEAVLRLVRSRIVAFVGGRLEYIVGIETFAKILRLPANATESAPLGNQVARVKDFDGLRDIFTSVLASVALDLPFILLFLGVLAAISPQFVIVPLVMLLLYGLCWAVLVRPLRRAVKAASQAKARRHGFLVEAITNMRTLKESGVEDIWSERFREVSADASIAHHRSNQVSLMFQTVGQTIMMGSGLATLYVGVNLAMAGEVSLGALIAAMALTWRLLSPIQNLFLTFARAEQTKVTLTQIDNLMKLREEKAASQTSSSGLERVWQGGVRLKRVSLRYSQEAEPALLGVNLTVKPNEFVAITGSNGAGKTTLLRVILGLHFPQVGNILLDGVDLRQIPPRELRRAIAYVPQSSTLFHGSIAQNLRLGNPNATQDELEQACRLAGVYEEISLLPRGLDTRIGDQSIAHMNSGLLQRITLARAYADPAPVLVMDEPAYSLDNTGDAALIAALKKLHGKRTIIMVSHRPSHLNLADRVLRMDNGALEVQK